MPMQFPPSPYNNCMPTIVLCKCLQVSDTHLSSTSHTHPVSAHRWHIFVSLGFYFLILFTAFDRLEVLEAAKTTNAAAAAAAGPVVVVRWWLGVVPYVRVAEHME